MTSISRILPLAGMLATACGVPEEHAESVDSGAESAAMTTAESPAPLRAPVEGEAAFRTATFAAG